MGRVWGQIYKGTEWMGKYSDIWGMGTSYCPFLFSVGQVKLFLNPLTTDPVEALHFAVLV